VHYYSAIKKNEIMSFTGKWMELKMMFNEISQYQIAKYHVLAHRQNKNLKLIILTLIMEYH
jgi:hypothetical protein